MDEVKFALKMLGAALAVVLMMQIKVSGATVEDHTEDWIRTSSLTKYLQKVADGGALAIRNGSHAVANYANQALGNNEVQKASRLNLNISRSPAATAVKHTNSRTENLDKDEPDQE